MMSIILSLKSIAKTKKLQMNINNRVFMTRNNT